jgi:hypothetical protein
MKKTLPLLFLCSSLLFLFAGCVDDGGDDVSYDEADLVGKWQKDNTQEYWRYDSGHYGETWDAGEDVQEGEGTKFSWSLEGSTLEVLLTGEMGQVVPYDYKVLALTATAMRLEDDYDNEYTYHKI